MQPLRGGCVYSLLRAASHASHLVKPKRLALRYVRQKRRHRLNIRLPSREHYPPLDGYSFVKVSVWLLHDVERIHPDPRSFGARVTGARGFDDQGMRARPEPTDVVHHEARL